MAQPSVLYSTTVLKKITPFLTLYCRTTVYILVQLLNVLRVHHGRGVRHTGGYTRILCMYGPYKKDKDRRDGKGHRCCLGDRIDSIPDRTIFFFARMVLKKRMKRIKATWRNGCFEKINDHPVDTIPNHHPTKMDVLPITFVQIILAANWLVRHSRTSTKQQRRPLPSLTFF